MKNTKESIVPVGITPLADDINPDCVMFFFKLVFISLFGNWLSFSVDTSE